MNIKIEIHKSKNSSELKNKIEKLLAKKFGKYNFLYETQCKVMYHEPDNYDISVTVKPKKGKLLFSNTTNEDAYQGVIAATSKLRTPIEKYKEKHYQNPHTVNKDIRNI